MSDSQPTTTTSSSSASTILAAFAIGALTGGVIALLYAPQSGKETRELIKRRSRELTKKAGKAFNGAKKVMSGNQKRFVAAVHAGKQAVRKELAK